MNRQLLSCPNCSAHLSVKSHLEGKSVSCPACKKLFTIAVAEISRGNDGGKNGDPGYLYIMLNAHYDKLLKIGRTGKVPSERAKQLSAATGVPTPFVVAFEVEVSDMVKAEASLHALLESAGYRVNKNREFFEVPLDQAMEFMKEVASQFQPAARTVRETTLTEPSDLLIRLERDAGDAYDGSSLGVPHFKKALALYKQAADLGSHTALRMLARMHALGEGVRANSSNSIECLISALEVGMPNDEVIHEASFLAAVADEDTVGKELSKFCIQLCESLYEKGTLDQDLCFTYATELSVAGNRNKALEVLNDLVASGNELAHLRLARMLAITEKSPKKKTKSHYDRFWEVARRRIESGKDSDQEWLEIHSCEIAQAIGTYFKICFDNRLTISPLLPHEFFKEDLLELKSERRFHGVTLAVNKLFGKQSR